MRILISLFILGLSAVAATAQETPEDWTVSNTPRQEVLDQVIENSKPDIVLDLRGTSESIVETQPALTEIITKKKTKKDPEKEIIEMTTLAPFYVSARDYLALRGDKKHDQLVLDYEVATSSLDDGAKPGTENIRLIIGSDYASIQGLKSQRIFDFKMNRFLEITPVKTPEDESKTTLLFDNISMFAKAYRNIATVRQATQNGKMRKIQISKDQKIDSFWLESSMGWAVAELEGALKVKSTKTRMLAIWDGLSVVSADFEGEAYENDQFKNALFAFAHHVWPIHPQIMVEVYGYNTPPNSLEMVSFGPAQPKGQKQKWTLKNREIAHASFPLPDVALSVVERQPVSPLVFVISEAVKNRALGGVKTPQQIENDFETAANDDDKVGQWLAGQKYIAYTGNCANTDENQLCAAIDDLTKSNRFTSIGSLDPKSKILSDFISATEMAKTKKTRTAALFTLQPYLDDEDTPAFILRSAAMARASMKKSEAEKSGFGSIQAEAMLKQALAKDPYDPHTYVGLAQIYAANGAYEQSWDFYDVLRAGISTVDAISLKIDQIESKLRATGPGYFLSD